MYRPCCRNERRETTRRTRPKRYARVYLRRYIYFVYTCITTLELLEEENHYEFLII